VSFWLSITEHTKIRYFDSPVPPDPPRSGPPCPPHDLIPSGLNPASDYPFHIPKEARIGLRFKITSNKAYFGNRANLIGLIKADSCPDLTSNRHLTHPEKRGRKNASMGLLWVLCGAQFWLILANRALYLPFFVSRGIGRFYGRIFERIPTNPVCGFTPVRLRRESPGRLPGTGYCCVGPTSRSR